MARRRRDQGTPEITEDQEPEAPTAPAPAAPVSKGPQLRHPNGVAKQRPPAERAARFASRLKRQAAELYPDPVKEPTPAEMMAKINELQKRLDDRG